MLFPTQFLFWWRAPSEPDRLQNSQSLGAMELLAVTVSSPTPS